MTSIPFYLPPPFICYPVCYPGFNLASLLSDFFFNP